MPDTLTLPPIAAREAEYLAPAIRAALERAYQQGRKDALREMAVAIGAASDEAPKPRRPRGPDKAPRKPRGSMAAMLLRAMPDAPTRFADIARLVAPMEARNVASNLIQLMNTGHVTRLERGLYVLTEAGRQRKAWLTPAGVAALAAVEG